MFVAGTRTSGQEYNSLHFEGNRFLHLVKNGEMFTKFGQLHNLFWEFCKVGRDD